MIGDNFLAALAAGIRAAHANAKASALKSAAINHGEHIARVEFDKAGEARRRRKFATKS